MITSIKCSIWGFFGVYFRIPHPLSLIVGTISAINNKSNRLMGCSREVAGGTHSTKCSSQCKLPIGDWARGSPHSWARRVAQCPCREHTSSPCCATRLKINTAFAITCELRALFTGADFHFTWSVPAYPYCSGWTAEALLPMRGEGCWTKDIT